MIKTPVCKLGIHRWGRATFIDYGSSSSVRDWKQICSRCGKRITWVQPNGLGKKFYPIYWTKWSGWPGWVVLGLIVVGLYSVFRWGND